MHSTIGYLGSVNGGDAQLSRLPQHKVNAFLFVCVNACCELDSSGAQYILPYEVGKYVYMNVYKIYTYHVCVCLWICWRRYSMVQQRVVGEQDDNDDDDIITRSLPKSLCDFCFDGRGGSGRAVSRFGLSRRPEVRDYGGGGAGAPCTKEALRAEMKRDGERDLFRMRTREAHVVLNFRNIGPLYYYYYYYSALSSPDTLHNNTARNVHT